MTGRPSEFRPDLGDEICAVIERTGSIRQAVSETGVSRTTIARWAEMHPDFGAAIARAKRDGYDERAEQASENAKSAKDAALGRLAFDAERWYLSKIDPKRYGDRLDHTSSDGSMTPKPLTAFYEQGGGAVIPTRT